MAGQDLTRRTLLRTGGSLVGLATSGALAGCGDLLGGSEPTGDVSALQVVPPTSLLAIDADVDAILADRPLWRAVDANLAIAQWLSRDVPDTTAGILDAIRARIGLDPRGVSRVVGFGARDADADLGGGLNPFVGGYWGTVAWTDWKPPAVRNALEERWGSVTERRRSGTRVFVVPAGEIAVTGDGRVVAAPGLGVSGALEAMGGGATAPTDQLADALGAARPGVVRLGLAPRATTPSGTFGDPLALLAGKIRYVSGALYRDGQRRGVQWTFETGSGPDAEDVHEALDSFLALARSGQFEGPLRSALEPVETDRSGTAVTARYEAPVDAFATWLTGVGASVLLDR